MNIISVGIGTQAVTVVTQEHFKYCRQPPARDRKPGDAGWERFLGKAKYLMKDLPTKDAIQCGELLAIRQQLIGDQLLETRYIFTLKEQSNADV